MWDPHPISFKWREHSHFPSRACTWSLSSWRPQSLTRCRPLLYWQDLRCFSTLGHFPAALIWYTKHMLTSTLDGLLQSLSLPLAPWKAMNFNRVTSLSQEIVTPIFETKLWQWSHELPLKPFLSLPSFTIKTFTWTHITHFFKARESEKSSMTFIYLCF